MSVTETTDIAVHPTREIQRYADEEWSVERIVQQAQKIQQCMKAVMKVDEHYGVIPGTARDGKPGKPTLLKPGAEKLCLMFRLCPEYETMRADTSPALIAYSVRCILTHIPTGNRVATGLGSCNSREEKYRRAAPKKCPNCGKETIFKSKEENGGYYCWAKKGGCSRTFKGTEADIIENQPTGIADPSDLDNTILKMACKRALVAAVLNGTAASDCFTQDLEDLTEKAAEYTPPAPAVDKRAAATSVPRTVPAQRVAEENYRDARAADLRAEFAAEGPPSDDWPPPADAVTTIDGRGNKVTEARASNKQKGAIHMLADKCQMTAAERAGLMQLRYNVGSSVDMSTSQASDFIDYLGKRIRATEALSPVDMIPPPTDEDAPGNVVPMRSEDTGEAAAPEAYTAIRDRMVALKFKRAGGVAWLNALFGVEKVGELTKDQAATAMSLLLAMADLDQDDTPAYTQLLAKFAAAGKVRQS